MKNIDLIMGELTEYTRLQEEIDAIFDYFKFHSKNLTKKARMEVTRITRFNSQDEEILQ